MTDAGMWRSSNVGVATVSPSGIVTAISAGTATLTVSFEGKSGSVAVTVSATSADTESFLGTVVGPNTVSGTLGP